jgi:hypothetical protein
MLNINWNIFTMQGPINVKYKLEYIYDAGTHNLNINWNILTMQGPINVKCTIIILHSSSERLHVLMVF